jgi:hypothetical protein
MITKAGVGTFFNYHQPVMLEALAVNPRLMLAALPPIRLSLCTLNIINSMLKPFIIRTFKEKLTVAILAQGIDTLKAKLRVTRQ